MQEEKWFAKYIKNVRIVVLLILTILAIGISSLLTLQKRLNPDINLTIVTVTTVLPGAGPADTESLLTNPLEDKLKGVKGIDTITSSSLDNVSSIVMQFKSGIDKDKARNDVQTAVNSVSNLPGDSQKPVVTALDFEDRPIWNFTITSNADTPSLMRFTDNLKTKIEDINNIDRVVLDGFDTQEIAVKVSPEKIRNLKINPLEIAKAVQNSTIAFPAGSVQSNNSTFSLSIDKDVTSVEDIRNLVLSINNQPIRLGDIAEVSLKSEPNIEKNFIATKTDPAKQTVSFFVYKSSSADIVTTLKNVENLVDREINNQNGKFQITTITNLGEEINKQFTDVLGEFRSTLILVFLNLLLFLGLRQALIACITIPLTFLLSFGWMSALGQTINFISLFALLLAFGTSIDDTIVTVSAMTNYYKSGKLTPHETGIKVWNDFVVPIWTTTITTVWAFLPLILTTGIIGEFIKPIPITVATTMYSSTAVAWFITLPLLIVFLNPKFPPRVKNLIKALLVIASVILVAALSPKGPLTIFIILSFIILLAITYNVRQDLSTLVKEKFLNIKLFLHIKAFFNRLLSNGFINLERLEEKYKNAIEKAIESKQSRRIVIGGLIIYAVVAYALLPLGLVKNEFFPKSNQDIIYVNVELPAGTDIQKLSDESLTLLEQFRATPELRAAMAEPGKALDASGRSGNSTSSILFSLTLTPKESRKISSTKIAEDLRTKFSNYSKGKLSVIEQGGGPPAGADIQIKLLGDDLSILDQNADKTISFLKTQPGVINVDKSIKSGTSKLTFVPDKVKMSSAGITEDTVAFWLRLAASGFKLDTLRLNSKDNDIVFYLNNENLKPEDLGRLSIPTNNGNFPLMSLGKVILTNNPTIINHDGGKRIVTISGGVKTGYSVSDENKSLIKFASENLGLPEGYSWQTGGVNEENTKSVQSIFRAMILSFILIMATMVIEFGSFRQAAMILSLIPFAVAGVFYVFGLTGTPLSFPALIGVMALFGVVVTNAMFIVEKINQNRKQGMHIDEALSDAGKSRLEPIILTSLTSILGLIPITLANALWRGLGGAIISGLLFSGLIMLFYIPVIYKAIYSREE